MVREARERAAAEKLTSVMSAPDGRGEARREATRGEQRDLLRRVHDVGVLAAHLGDAGLVDHGCCWLVLRENKTHGRERQAVSI